MKINNCNFKTCLKWTGTKRRYAPIINSYIGDNIEEYFEPFLGSGAVMIDFLGNYVNPNLKYVSASDTNPDLIALWKLIKDDVNTLINAYDEYWHEYNKCGYYETVRKSREDQTPEDTKIIETRRSVYNKKRDEYNKIVYTGTVKAGIDLFCLMHTSFNGLIRYGKHGFNASAMPVKVSRFPDDIAKELKDISALLNYYNVQFYCQSYDTVKLHTNNAVIYMDPPYELLAENGLYHLNSFDFEKLSNYVKNTNYKRCIISFDGGDYGDKWFMQPDMNVTKTSIDTGISKFIQQRHTLKTKGSNIKRTHESLYIIDK